MQKIPLELAQPGMVLDKPILRDNGLVLVAQGTELSDVLIGRLENMKVKYIHVQGEPLDLEGMTSGTSYSQRLERLDHLFRRHADDVWMMKIKAFLHQYFASRAAGQAAAKPKDEEHSQGG